jgi:hypothetical protein
MAREIFLYINTIGQRQCQPQQDYAVSAEDVLGLFSRGQEMLSQMGRVINSNNVYRFANTLVENRLYPRVRFAHEFLVSGFSPAVDWITDTLLKEVPRKFPCLPRKYDGLDSYGSSERFLVSRELDINDFYNIQELRGAIFQNFIDKRAYQDRLPEHFFDY